MHMPQDAQCRKGSRAEAFLMHRNRMLSAGATVGGIIIVCFSVLYFLQTLRSDRRQPLLAVAGPLKMASGGGVPMTNPQDHAQKMHHLPEWGVPGI
jgi:hypothetical protein